MLTYREEPEAERGPADLSSPHPSLSLAIRNLMLAEVSADVDADSAAVRALAEKIRRGLALPEMRRRNPFRSVAGADAGSQILPLASRRYAVISALVYSLPSGSCFFLSPESLSFPYTLSGERFKGTVDVLREAKLYETACAFIEGRPGAQLIFVDGPLAFSNWWGVMGRSRDRQRLISAVNRFLRLCMEEDVAVAGVVKRPSARFLVYHLKLQGETDLSDAFLLLQAMRPGERTEVFSPRAALRQVVRTAPFMDAIGCPIYSFYGRFSRDWFIPPVRVDVPAFSLGRLDEIADFCYWSGFWNGIPLPIVRADEEVRISKRFMGEIFTEIVSYVGRRTGEISHLAPYWGEGSWMRV
ncbi:MAG: DNA double-strand break repair nuclease NurA [Candidatus Bathyarchaeia archaeon]